MREIASGFVVPFSLRERERDRERGTRCKSPIRERKTSHCSCSSFNLTEVLPYSDSNQLISAQTVILMSGTRQAY